MTKRKEKSNTIRSFRLFSFTGCLFFGFGNFILPLTFAECRYRGLRRTLCPTLFSPFPTWGRCSASDTHFLGHKVPWSQAVAYTKMRTGLPCIVVLRYLNSSVNFKS